MEEDLEKIVSALRATEEAEDKLLFLAFSALRGAVGHRIAEELGVSREELKRQLDLELGQRFTV